MRKRFTKAVLGLAVLMFMMVLGGCDDPLLEPPAAPYITGYFTNTYTKIEWSSVTDATEYIIYYAPNSQGQYATPPPTSTFIKLGSTKSTSYTDYTGFARFYSVKASNSAGDSGFSNVIWTY
jgi:uncharacterized protein (DUF427 family)